MTNKLCKRMFLGLYQEFIGLDICDEVNTSEESKQTVFHSIEPPIAFSYLRMLLGMLRFYALWIPLFEIRMLPRKSLRKQGHRKVQGGVVQT